MKTLKILALACLLVAPTFADKKHIILGQVTKPKFNETPGRSSTSDAERMAERINESRINESMTVKVMTPIKHRVKKGENLYRIAKRYRVTVDEIRSHELNSKLADRKNKNLLLPGEVINIPAYHIAERSNPADANLRKPIFRDGELVAMVPFDFMVLQRKAINSEVKNQQIERLENSLGIAKKYIFSSTVVILALLTSTVLFGFGWLNASRREQKLKEQLADADKNITALSETQLSQTGSDRELI